MVVVSSSWAKNAAPPVAPINPNFTYQPNLVLDSMVISETSQQCTNNNTSAPPVSTVSVLNSDNMSSSVAIGCARAELHCRPNSYHFQERVLSLQQPVKVGRSVARARAAQDNAIFDCKVLSRHHAILWYDAGKFYLQDTNSSNGTFVNNSRLPSSEDKPHEVNSGDIVQFGVDVVENNKKVTHGCIIATLKLYMPDGKEAKASPSISETSNQCVPLDELYLLKHIIQEASQREICLETKLSALQLIVEQTKKSADESWQAYIGEERLLSRVATLENQLSQASKNWTDDRLKQEISKLQDEKTDYQYSAKKALEKVHGERLEAVKIAAEQQRARAAAEHDAFTAKDQLEAAQQELQDIAQKLIAEEKKTQEAKVEFDQTQKELLEKLDEETQQVFELHNALVQLRQAGINANTEILEKYNIICTNDNEIDDFRHKEDIIKAENDLIDNEVELNKSNGLIEQTEIYHINNQQQAQVTSILEAPEVKMPPLDIKSDVSDNDSATTVTDVNASEAVSDSEDDSSSVSEASEVSCVNSVIDGFSKNLEEDLEENLKYSSEEKDEKVVDTKTLKYHVQSIHSQYKQEIALLQAEALKKEQLLQQITANRIRLEKEKEANLLELNQLREDHQMFKQNFKETLNECQQLKDRLQNVQDQQKVAEEKLQALKDSSEEIQEKKLTKEINADISDTLETSMSSSEAVSLTDTVSILETELITLKERYAQLTDEKTALNKKLQNLNDDYNALCNRSYNTMFYYIAPLVFMVIYLLVSSMFS